MAQLVEVDGVTFDVVSLEHDALPLGGVNTQPQHLVLVELPGRQERVVVNSVDNVLAVTDDVDSATTFGHTKLVRCKPQQRVEHAHQFGDVVRTRVATHLKHWSGEVTALDNYRSTAPLLTPTGTGAVANDQYIPTIVGDIKVLSQASNVGDGLRTAKALLL